MRAIAKAGADGVIVASALVDALGPDGRDVRALGRLVAPCVRPPPAAPRRPLTDTRAMPDKRIAVYLETTDKKVFACAQDWPGWCRAGKDEELALQALADAAPRTRRSRSRRRSTSRRRRGDGFEVVQRIPGGAGTAFGVPSASSKADRRPVDAAEAERLAALVEASWTSSTAPALGPRSPSGKVRAAAAVTATR